MTRTALIACLLAAGGLTSGCTASLKGATAPRAIETAETRAHYDLACAKPKGQIVSTNVQPPAVTPPPLFNASAIPHANYEVAISGCGDTRKVPVMCSQEMGCFAGAPA